MTGDRYARYALVDEQRTVYLGNGFDAAVAIGPHGQTRFWLLSPDPDTHHIGCVCPNHVPHEQLGALPARYRQRLRAVPLRCGAPTLTGNPCRTPVYRPGDRCGHHRHQEAT